MMRNYAMLIMKIREEIEVATIETYCHLDAVKLESVKFFMCIFSAITFVSVINYCLLVIVI